MMVDDEYETLRRNAAGGGRLASLRRTAATTMLEESFPGRGDSAYFRGGDFAENGGGDHNGHYHQQEEDEEGVLGQLRQRRAAEAAQLREELFEGAEPLDVEAGNGNRGGGMASLFGSTRKQRWQKRKGSGSAYWSEQALRLTLRAVFKTKISVVVPRMILIFGLIQLVVLMEMTLDEPLIYPTTLVSLTPSDQKQVMAEAAPFRLGVFTTMWKRPMLTDFVLAHWHQMKLEVEHDGLILELFVVGSEGNQSRALAQKHGWAYYEHENQPLGKKHNAGFRAMREEFPNMDAVMIIGSDDIVNKRYPEMCREYLQNPRKHPYGCKEENCTVDMVAMMDIYFLDMESMVIGYTGGYNKEIAKRRDYTLGFGRCVRSKVMDLVGWAPWADEQTRYLDGAMYKSLDHALMDRGGLPKHTVNITCREEGIMPIDIKSNDGTNVSPWIHIKLSTVGYEAKDGEKCPFNHDHPKVLQQMDFYDASKLLDAFPASYLGWLLDVHAGRDDEFLMPDSQAREAAHRQKLENTP